MEFVRKSVLVLIVPLLVIFLFATAGNTAGTSVITKPEKVKSVVSRSGVYDSVVPGLLDQAGQITAGGTSVSTQSELVRQAAEKTFTPDFVKRNTEQVIDSIYTWLNGDTPLPDFNIDLTADKAKFAANVGDAVEQRLASLPACTAASGVPDTYDPLAATCLPRGVEPASAASTVEQGIVSGTGFLDHPVITADSLKPEGNGKSIFSSEELKQVPEIYQNAKLLPYILGGLALLLALGVIFISSSKRKGIRRVGIVLFAVGLVLLFIAYDLERIVGEGLEQLNLNNAVVEDKFRAVVIELTKEVDKIYWIFGGAYTGLGILAILWSIWRAPKDGRLDKDDLEGEGQTPEDRIDIHEPDEPAEFVGPTEAVDKPIHKPKPKPTPKKPPAKKIKIQ